MIQSSMPNDLIILALTYTRRPIAIHDRQAKSIAVARSSPPRSSIVCYGDALVRENEENKKADLSSGAMPEVEVEAETVYREDIGT